MTCKCGCPIPPQIVIMREGFTIKEIPNYTDWTCAICGTKYKLRSYKGKIEILE
jgi:hypothetical protein